MHKEIKLSITKNIFFSENTEQREKLYNYVIRTVVNNKQFAEANTHQESYLIRLYCIVLSISESLHFLN